MWDEAKLAFFLFKDDCYSPRSMDTAAAAPQLATVVDRNLWHPKFSTDPAAIMEKITGGTNLIGQLAHLLCYIC